MKKMLDYVRTTVIGGVLFLLPLLLVYFVVDKAIAVVAKLAAPIVARLGVHSIAGIAVSTIVTLTGLVLGAFLIGLFARTRAGQAFLGWIEQGIVTTLPQFGLVQRMVKNFESKDLEDIPVVFVPTDAGWQLGMLLEPPQDDWFAVFLPGSPELASGAVVYAHADQVRRAGISAAQLWSIMRRRGATSAKVYGRLASMRAAGQI